VAAVVFCLMLGGGHTLFSNLGGLLAACDAPRAADLIITTSGSPGRIAKAALLLRQGYAERVLVTTEESYRLMVGLGVSPEKVVRASWSADSTYEEGLLIRELLAGPGSASALVVSDPFHLLRVKWTLHHLFAGDAPRFFFVSSDAPEFQGFWWDNQHSRLFVLHELPKLVYYWFWHGMLGFVDDPPWALRLERMYVDFLRVRLGNERSPYSLEMFNI